MHTVISRNIRTEYFIKKYGAEIATILDMYNCDMSGPYYDCPHPYGTPLLSMASHTWYVHQSFKGSQSIRFALNHPENGYIINLQYADIEYCTSLESAVEKVARHLEMSVISGFYQKYYIEKYVRILEEQCNISGVNFA